MAIDSGGGQTKGNPSSWTTDSLKTYIERIIDLHDQRYEQRHADQKEAVRAALASSEKAVEKAESIAEKWRLNANEWRDAMSDKDNTYFTKESADIRFGPLEKFMERRTGAGSYLLNFITLIGVIVAILIALRP